jgi:hypothetical protein
MQQNAIRETVSMVDQHILDFGVGKFGLVNVPTTLFKYFDDAVHARDFLTRGVLRIGTLYDFRRIESHTAARGDATEGHVEYIHRSVIPELITLENAPAPIRQHIERTGIPIALHGGAITAYGDHPDCYVYCASASPHAAADYGSHCIQIDDLAGFLTDLSRHLHQVRTLLTDPHGFAAPCLYRDRIRLSRSLGEFQELPMAFIKPPSRSADEEVRAVWHPVEQPIEPFVTECASLTRYLSQAAV